ncbi:MAG: hypothetical protein NC200_07245 [Candidatus Gastranaerophilales bacterium]|nr:hypothetical protein [Candidatus Gastranaerophilales bacterium]
MNIKTTLDNIKAIKEIADSTQNIELKSLIVDLKEEILELKEENQKLKNELSKKIDFDMHFENDAYWNMNSNSKKEGPFCSACWDKSQMAVRMKSNTYTYECPVCQNKISNGKEIRPIRATW